MELDRQSKPMEKGYAERLYQAWNAAMPTTKVALTARVGRIENLARLNLVEGLNQVMS